MPWPTFDTVLVPGLEVGIDAEAEKLANRPVVRELNAVRRSSRELRLRSDRSVFARTSRSKRVESMDAHGQERARIETCKDGEKWSIDKRTRVAYVLCVDQQDGH
jgi:hypothetical protein